METLWPRIALALQRMEEDQRRQSELLDRVDETTIRIDRTTQQVAEHISEIHDAQVQRPPLPSRPGPFGDLTGGLFGLPGSVATKVEDYLHEYLGTTAQPVPFGGRDHQLNELDQWLGDPTRPLALILAPGGRGKSALVCQWAARVAREGRAGVALLPISIRFDTALRTVAYPLLGARLRDLVGSGQTGPTYPDVDSWLTEIDTYLREDQSDHRPLLVLIEGADEGTGWEVGRDLRFPQPLGQGVKVLVSTRPLPGDDELAWLRRLGRPDGEVHLLELPTLDRQAVRQVVLAHQDSLPNWEDLDNVVDELYRLSEGDPILVRLYVEALQRESGADPLLTPEDLSHLASGLLAFFQLWWDDLQRQWADVNPLHEPVARAILHALAHARGPLSRSDLVALSEPEGGSGVLISLLMPGLRRLVIGNEGSGYTFSHPRFGQFVREQLLTGDESRTWERRYIDYGRSIVARLTSGELAPVDVSPYVLEHFGAHLADAALDDPADLFGLVNGSWLRAWEQLTGTHNGFLDDLDRAWRAAATLDSITRSVSLQVRYAVVSASIHSLAGNIPLDLLSQLVETGQWTAVQGIAYARAMPSGPQCADALCVLSRLGGPFPHREAAEAAASFSDPRLRAKAMACVAARLAEVDAEESRYLFGELVSVVESIHRSEDRADTLRSITPLAPDLLVDDLVGLTHTIDDAYDKTMLLASLAARSNRLPLFEEAVDTLAEIANEGSRANALQSMVPELSQRLIPAALRVAERLGDPRDRALSVLALADRLGPKTQQRALRKAREAVEQIADPDSRLEVASALLPFLEDEVELAEYEEAVLAAMPSMFPGSQSQAALNVAGTWLEVGGIEAAVAAAHRFEDLETRAKLLVALLEFATDEALTRIADEALQAVSRLEPLHKRSHLLATLAPHLPEPRRSRALDQAVAAVETGGGALTRASMLLQILRDLPESDRTAVGTAATEAARLIANGRRRAELLALMAPFLRSSDRLRVLEEALAAVRGLQDEYSRVVWLTEIVPELEEDDQARVLDSAAGLITAIGEPLARVDAISRLLPHLTDARRSALAQEAVTALGTVAEAVASAGWEAAVGRIVPYGWWEWADLAAALGPYLDLPLLNRVLELARAIQEPVVEVRVLARLAAYFPPADQVAVVDEALAAVDHIGSDGRRAVVLESFVALPLPRQVNTVLAHATAIRDATARAHALIGLKPHLPQSRHAEALGLASGAVEDIDQPGDRVLVLVRLAPLLPTDEQVQAYRSAAATAAMIGDINQLAQVAPLLPEAERAKVLTQAIDVARRIAAPDARSDVLVFLVCQLAQAGDLERARGLAEELVDPEYRAQSRVCLEVGAAASGGAPDIDEALAAAATVARPIRRAELLLTMAMHSPQDRLAKVLTAALQAALTIPRDRERYPVLAELAPLLAGLQAEELLPLWSSTLRALSAGDRQRCLHDIVVLKAALRRAGGAEVLTALADVMVEVGHQFST